MILACQYCGGLEVAIIAGLIAVWGWVSWICARLFKRRKKPPTIIPQDCLQEGTWEDAIHNSYSYNLTAQAEDRLTRPRASITIIDERDSFQ
jgi:hypothetical protein